MHPQVDIRAQERSFRRFAAQAVPACAQGRDGLALWSFAPTSREFSVSVRVIAYRNRINPGLLAKTLRLLSTGDSRLLDIPTIMREDVYVVLLDHRLRFGRTAPATLVAAISSRTTIPVHLVREILERRRREISDIN